MFSSLIRSSAILCSGGSQSDLRMNGMRGAGGSPGFLRQLKKYSFFAVSENSSNSSLEICLKFCDGTGQNLRPFAKTDVSAGVSIILVRFMIFPSR